MRFLVLRPAVGAKATAERARALGHDAIVAPLFAYRPLAWTAIPPVGIDAVLLTSAAAARLGGEGLESYRHLPVQAVGAATAAAARAAEFANVSVGTTDARAAVAALSQSGHRNVLHLAGLDHVEIAHPDIVIRRIQVYAADAVTTLPDTASRALDSDAIALLHSPRAAHVFAGLLECSGRPRSRVRIACFSMAVAGSAGEGWAGEGWADIAVARQPVDEALFAAAAMLCDQAGHEAREPQ